MELLHILISHSAFLFRYALIAFLLLNLFVRFLLPLFLPFSGSIGHFTPSSIHNVLVKWNGIKIEVKSLGISVRRGGKAWFVLHGEGIKVTVHRSTLLDLLSKPTEKNERSGDGDYKPTLKSNSSLLRRTFLPFFIRRLTHLISVNLDVDIDVEEVGVIRGTVKFGGQYKKPHLRVPIVGAPRQEDKLTLWASVENLSMTEPLRGLDQKEHKTLLPAAEMREKIIFRLSGPMGYEEWKNLQPRKGSIRASMEIEEEKRGFVAKLKRARQEDGEKKGLIIRIHEVKRLLRGIEELQCEVKCRRKDRRDTGSPSTRSESSATPPPPHTKLSPLVYFDSFAISLPTIIFSLHYTTPLSILATSSPSVNESLPQTIAFAIILSGIKGSLTLKDMSDGDSVRDSHKVYLGKNRLCEVVGSIGWDELEGRIDVEGKEGESISCLQSVSSSPADDTWRSVQVTSPALLRRLCQLVTLKSPSLRLGSRSRLLRQLSNDRSRSTRRNLDSLFPVLVTTTIQPSWSRSRLEKFEVKQPFKPSMPQFESLTLGHALPRGHLTLRQNPLPAQKESSPSRKPSSPTFLTSSRPSRSPLSKSDLSALLQMRLQSIGLNNCPNPPRSIRKGEGSTLLMTAITHSDALLHTIRRAMRPTTLSSYHGKLRRSCVSKFQESFSPLEENGRIGVSKEKRRIGQRQRGWNDRRSWRRKG